MNKKICEKVEIEYIDMRMASISRSKKILMVDIDAFKKLALSFPDTMEMPHFEKTSFRTKKRIYATLDAELQRACLKLNAIDQSVFCTIDPTMIYPVNNKWGKQGWTIIELKKVKKNLLKDALSKAYATITPTKPLSKK